MSNKKSADRRSFLCMKDYRFQNDADTTQDKQNNSCRIHLRFFDFVGEAVGKRQCQEFRGEGDQNEKKFYYSHSMYPGGLRTRSTRVMREQYTVE